MSNVHKNFCKAYATKMRAKSLKTYQTKTDIKVGVGLGGAVTRDIFVTFQKYTYF